MFSPNLAYWFLCQCVASNARCDKRTDCRDGSDEEVCDHNRESKIENDAAFSPAIVHLDSHGHYTIKSLASFSHCPETHFLCPGWSFCLPLCLSLPLSFSSLSPFEFRSKHSCYTTLSAMCDVWLSAVVTQNQWVIVFRLKNVLDLLGHTVLLL